MLKLRGKFRTLAKHLDLSRNHASILENLERQAQRFGSVVPALGLGERLAIALRLAQFAGRGGLRKPSRDLFIEAAHRGLRIVSTGH